MFGLGSKPQSPKIFSITPEYARRVIERSIADSNTMIAAAETVLGDPATSTKDKKRIADYIKDERPRVRVRGEILGLIGTAPVACNLEELIEFNTSFPQSKPGIDPVETFKEAMAAQDDD